MFKLHDVELRDVQSEDKEIIRVWRNLPEVARYMYTDHYITPEEHERWFQDIYKDPSRRYWVIVFQDERVGLVNLYDINHENRRCFWAFYIAGPQARGRGVGRLVEYLILQHVFGGLNFNKLCCEVLSYNEPVIMMHKSFGFKQEGYLRQHVIKSGRPIDVMLLAILRDEWEVERPKIELRLSEKGLDLEGAVTSSPH